MQKLSSGFEMQNYESNIYDVVAESLFLTSPRS
jgi:hypothetical protein